jgi:3-hydroxyacyl-CoA dehydrogenase
MIDAPLVLDRIREDPRRVAASNASASLLDLGDGVLCLEFHSKGNTVDDNTIAIVEQAFEIVPARYKALVIGNQGEHFSFGANLRSILRLLDEIGSQRERFRPVGKRFQRATTGMRTAPFPTVCAPFGLTIGGGLEMSMYCDRVHAHAGMRASLPEVAVGILPDLGGTSELYIRCIDAAGKGNEAAGLREAFATIVYAKRSKDAMEARSMSFLREQDTIGDDLARLLDEAKSLALELARDYHPQSFRAGVPVLGDAGFEALDGAVETSVRSGAATPFDAEIARAIARIMTGGPGPARSVSHQELLDLETEYFETLLFNPKSRERMEHILAQGTPLRN